MEYRNDPRPDLYEAELRRRANRVGLAFFIFLAVSFAASLILEIVYLVFAVPGQAVPSWLSWAITILSLYVFAAPLTYLLLRTVPAAPPTRRPMTPRAFFMFFLIAFTAMMAGSIIGQGVNQVVSYIVGSEQESQITEALKSSTFWLSCVYTLTIAPLMEELFFRKLLIDRLSCMGQGVCILVSGIVFGLFHGNFDQLFYAAFVGFLLAYIYVNTGNMWYCVALHSAFNFLGGIFPTIVERYAPDFTTAAQTSEEALLELTAAHPIAYLLTLLSNYLPLLLAIAGLVFLCKYRRRLLACIEPCPIPRGSRFRTVAVNPGFILFFIGCFAEILMSIFL
jgi:membrane protease YdiL (CAAX protease family)